MPAESGQQIRDYLILGKLGAGGMGVVYKAQDTRLHRIVALKFLPDLDAEPESRDRLLAEARAASALDHPNIGTIHAIEKTDDGAEFIVMAYYDGETLADRIRRGPVPPEEALAIATQVARGLAQAHARNIVHRDIKPSNVILTRDGLAKIVDFGLARLISASGPTASITTAGTIAYMSPEQVQARSVDQRSDIWSLGVVLQEMLAGDNPFGHGTAAAILMAILNNAPPSVPGVNPQLQAVIYRALAKDAAQRYQSCQELLEDLDQATLAQGSKANRSTKVDVSAVRRHAARSLAVPQGPGHVWKRTIAAAVLVAVAVIGGAVGYPRLRALFQHPVQHIAVLPFETIGNADPSFAALSDGLMETLTGRLSNLEVGQQALWVVPAGEVRRRKITDPAAARRDFGVTLVVTGSVQRDNQGVRLTLNLIDPDPSSMRQLGSASLFDPAGDFSALQDDAVSRLARLMGINVTPEMLRNTGGAVTPAAYEDYLKGRGYLQRYDKPGNVDAAVEQFENAARLDPRFALAFASLGDAYWLKYTLDQNIAWIDKASAYCQRAMVLNDQIPGVYVTLGKIQDGTGKHELALEQFQRAQRLDPRSADALLGTAQVYENMGRIAEAEAAYEKAAALRPDYWDGYSKLGVFYYRQRRYADAATQFRHVLQLTPDNAQTWANLAVMLRNLNRVDEAEAAFKKSISLAPGYAAYASLGNLYYQQSRYADAAAMTEKALQLNDSDYRVWANLALCYMWLNLPDKATAAYRHELGLLEKIAKVKTDDPRIQSELALLYANLGEHDNALTRARAALAMGPDDPRVLADVGEAYETLGDRKQAKMWIDKALAKGWTVGDLQRSPGLRNYLAQSGLKTPQTN